MNEKEQLLKEAKHLLTSSKQIPLNPSQRSKKTIELASLILQIAHHETLPEEKHQQTQLDKMMQDFLGTAFTIEMTDQGFRSHSMPRVANQIVYLIKKFGIPHYLTIYKRLQLWIFKFFAESFPNYFVPLAKQMLRKEASRVILPGEPSLLKEHLLRRKKEGTRVNLNHLGEAILGEEEALARLNTYLEDLTKPEVEYISIKVSTIFSQINLLAWQKTLDLLSERLRSLFRMAKKHRYIDDKGKAIHKFVNLDMEEYRDVFLTVSLFRQVLSEAEFLDFSAGIVLQSYLPDSYFLQCELTEWAIQRYTEGGAPIKIRIVKGANLAMEKVEASLKGWPQAPYGTKEEVDANFKRMVLFGCQPKHAQAVHLGIGSHNLFDIAYSLIIASEYNIEEYICIEMLEGMADPIHRSIQKLAKNTLLYCPSATENEFQHAIAYLTRRLDENTAPENFLRYAFNMIPGSKIWQDQAKRFSSACQKITTVEESSKRIQNRFLKPPFSECCSLFTNEPETDWSLPLNRQWGVEIMTHWHNRPHEVIPLVIEGKIIETAHKVKGEDPSRKNFQLYTYSQADWPLASQALQIAQNANERWSYLVQERMKMIKKLTGILRENRENLIGAMIADTGKTLPEADVEISEAIDFAEYYLSNFLEWISMEDLQWHPKGTLLIAPPWNFPCSIPTGCIVAALLTGNTVVFKPAPEAVLVGWHLVQLFWKSGIPQDVLQFITCDDESTGTRLIQDERIAGVVLTGSTETAKLFRKWRPSLDLIAETGGKNALIISNIADRDLAIRDLLQSAFGYAGQKCSACSLAICLKEVYDDPHFRKQLKDAASSLSVGSAWELKTRVNPLIRIPSFPLLKALTTLDEGEEWLLKPMQNPHNPSLWSPGIKLGVRAGSFMHQNELFGPILAVMRADNLQHAIDLANGTPYGLTAGIHTLDEREQFEWIENIQAGNCYINRGITGAVVQRQPFGGYKESSFGKGLKAGGPNYLTQFMHAKQRQIPRQNPKHPIDMPDDIQKLFKELESYPLNQEQRERWNISTKNYIFYWKHYFSFDHDPSHLRGQDNLLRYIPRKDYLVRLQHPSEFLDAMCIIAAAHLCKCHLQISADSLIIQDLRNSKCHLFIPNLCLIEETEKDLIERIVNRKVSRLRLLSSFSDALWQAAASTTCHLEHSPVLTNGRIELLHYLQERTISIDYHRYGNLGLRTHESFEQASPCSCQAL